MVRQYIGARYVPKFEGTHDPSRAYENLIVVDDGAGTSYISQKPVPIGTALTDTDYWAFYGSTNGAIVSLQNRVTALENGKNAKSELDVANFAGATVEDKLHNALDYVKANGYHTILTCNDEVIVTTPYDLYDANAIYEESWSTVLIRGAVFDFNGIPLFTGQSNELSFVPTFDGCEFNANVGGYVLDNSILTNYINPKFLNCIFYHVGVVNNASIDNSIYVQSPHLIGCKVYYANCEFIKTSKIWNGIIDGCQFEGSDSLCIEATRTIDGLMITNSLFEGFYNGSPVILDRGVLNAKILNNYFEKNRPHSIEIGQDYIYSVEVTGNSFYISVNNEIPIDITGNTTNANIIVSNNELITNDNSVYLANIEPYSAQRYGYRNDKLNGGSHIQTVFPARTTLGFQSGWAQELTDWTYTASGYKCSFDYYGDMRTKSPFLMGCIRGLSELNNSTRHTLNSIFTVNVIGTRDTGLGTDIWELKIEQLNAAVGRNTGTTANDVSITGVIVDDPDDTTHHTITLTVTCPSGNYGGNYLVGRVFDLMEVGVLEKTHT